VLKRRTGRQVEWGRAEADAAIGFLKATDRSRTGG